MTGDHDIDPVSRATDLTGPRNDLSRLGMNDLEHVRKYHPDGHTRRSARAAWLQQDSWTRPLTRPGPRTTSTPR